MAKYAFLVNDDGYKKYTYLAAEEAGASVPHIKSKLFKIHNAEPLNRYFELPFKRLWFQKVVDESKFQKDDVIIFILYESFHMSYSKKLINHYKKKYRNSRFVFFFTNPAGNYNLSRLNKIRDLIDDIFTFNKEDADKYGFKFLETEPFKLPVQKDMEPETDLFFIGEDKGRLPILLDLYERMTQLGLICDFWITGVPEEEQKYSDKIHYNQRITYEEVLHHDAKTRSIVEVLQDGKSYTSIRSLEALQYHKKVLTMSETVRERSFYDSQIFQVFHKPEEISADFIKEELDDNVFEKMNISTFDSFKTFIEKACLT